MTFVARSLGTEELNMVPDPAPPPWKYGSTEVDGGHPELLDFGAYFVRVSNVTAS